LKDRELIAGKAEYYPSLEKDTGASQDARKPIRL